MSRRHELHLSIDSVTRATIALVPDCKLNSYRAYQARIDILAELGAFSPLPKLRRRQIKFLKVLTNRLRRPKYILNGRSVKVR